MTVLLALIVVTHRQVLEVGDDKPYHTIAAAVTSASPGDSILVFPSQSHYRGEHVLINKANLTIEASGGPVLVDGGDFDYSGSGQVPRAIFQIGPGGNGATIKGFELVSAHNQSGNGAGVRIDGANDVTIQECNIHGNDMGIMSAGHFGTADVGSHQVIEGCEIHENGSQIEAGYNHNLYLGGESVRIENCQIYKPLTGHNLKSRAHFTLVRYCEIHDAHDRELDLVDSEETARPNSNAVLIGNLIAKDPLCPGNHEVIHFGQEKGTRDGCLFLINNTIITQFASPVVALETLKNRVDMVNNVVVNVSERDALLFRQPVADMSVSGHNNWISFAYDVPPPLAQERFFGGLRDSPLATEGINTVDPNINGSPSKTATYRDGNGVEHSGLPDRRRQGRGRWVPTSSPFLGAG